MKKTCPCHSSSHLTAFAFIWLACASQLVFCSPTMLESAEIPTSNSKSSPRVQLHISDDHVVMDNGIVQVTLTKPGGLVIRVSYNGMDNLLEFHNRLNNRGYWDMVWNKPGDDASLNGMIGTSFTIITENENQVELSFSRTWNHDDSETPVNIDKRYIMRRGSSGFYVYAIMERPEGWPDVDMNQIRIVFKLRRDKFRYMALTDDRQRIMPTDYDRRNGETLAYREAVLLTRSSNPQLRGEVDDKYQYTKDHKSNKVHGWISQDSGVGFWLITPSQEFLAGGPAKQELTSHVGPTCISVFTGSHYVGSEMDTEYRNGEPWKKVFGPIFVYLNFFSPDTDYKTFWDDAKTQVSIEEKQWPYSFVNSEDFPSSNQRGTVSGQLFINDQYMYDKIKGASDAYVGLAAPGSAGSWQFDTKGYQFWTRADKTGHFTIKNVRAGNYNLYAWIPGVVSDYKYEENIIVLPGSEMDLGLLMYNPPRNGPTLWEIGYPDRKAAEFFVPDANPNLENRLYNDLPGQKFRQYGLWDRYTDLYPEDDLTYTIGASNYTRDWYFAHVPRNTGNNTYGPTTWQIKFELQNVARMGDYTLQLALASAQLSDLQIRFNHPGVHRPHFSTRLIGRDNAIARHGIHGVYRFYSVNVPGRRLLEGENTVYLTLSRVRGPFQGIMYDYIRFEGPPS